MLPNNPHNGNGLVQPIRVGHSIWPEWVNVDGDYVVVVVGLGADMIQLDSKNRDIT